MVPIAYATTTPQYRYLGLVSQESFASKRGRIEMGNDRPLNSRIETTGYNSTTDGMLHQLVRGKPSMLYRSAVSRILAGDTYRSGPPLKLLQVIIGR